MTFVYILHKTLDWSKRIQMTFLKSIFHPEVSCSAHLYIISPRSSQKIVSREPRYFRALGGFAHTTFAHRKIFGASDFLNFNFKMRLWPQKWSHGLWNPEILSHVKYGPNLTIKRPLKRVLKYISAVCLHFYL